jgi:hypothetical protein
MSKTDQELRDASDFNEDWAERSAFGVLVGLIAEVALAIFVPTCPETIIGHWGPVGADALVTLGVGGEFIFGRRSRKYTAELNRRSEDRLAAANIRAGEANKKAEEAQLAHTELLAVLAPRTLSKAEAEQFMLKMHAFSGVRADLMSYAPGNPEPTRVCRTLINLLHEAGWRMNNIPSAHTLGSLEGVFVGTYDGADEITRRAATALIDVLNEVGWMAGKWTLPLLTPEIPGAMIDGRYLAPLRIMVGFKPQPIPSAIPSTQATTGDPK